MSQLRDLPKPASDAIIAETQGEVIRWVGRPDPGMMFRRTTPIWLMGIPWLALSGGMFGALIASAFFSPPPQRVIPQWEYVGMGLALVFISAFVLIGLGMMGAPFWVWWTSRRMAYVVTDRRLVRIGWRRRGMEVKSFDPTTFIAMERAERRDGSGTLIITTRLTKDSDGDSSKETEMIIGVKEVRTLDKLLRAFADARRNGGSDGAAPTRQAAE